MTMTKDEFFRQPLYMLHVTGWPPEAVRPPKPLEEPVLAPDGARLALWPTDPADQRHIPPADQGAAYQTARFSLVNSGNRTLYAPKRSWKVDLEPDGGGERLAGMTTVNLKAMYNDPSQLREALAWRLFARAGVPSSRHTYAKLGLNATYMGLFSVIEQVDKRYLKDRFGDNDEGNLYKAACGQLGCATLERRVGADGRDDGRQYIAERRGDQTYRLMTNKDDPAANAYEDLARLIRVVDGAGLDGGEARFEGAAFRRSVEEVLNVRAFLRWAGVNVLIGSWDNYFATPSNYFLYNSGRRGDEHGFMASPYFTFIPWDYDNSFGIDFFDTRWQDTDLVDWAANTGNYGRRNSNGQRSRIPLVQHLLRNRDFLRYYLDHVEFLLDTEVNPDAVAAVIGAGGGGLWDRVARSAYLESDTPHGWPFTGRQFTNHEVYRTDFLQEELRRGEEKAEGIVHYVRMRHDRARAQLADLRHDHPAGSSGASFPVALESLP
jgi:CotH kinase protein